MAKNLEKYDKLVTAILAIVIFVLGIGWWFAEEKSEPVYLTKIDKLMFDKNNKAPKHILTLPDKFVATSKRSDDSDFEKKVEPIKKQVVSESEFSLEELLAGVPNIMGLADTPPSITNKYVDFSEDMVETLESGQKYPKVSDLGHKPWVEYGNIVQTQPNFKKVAIVINNLGMDVIATEKIAKVFPSEVSISLSPYTVKSFEMLTAARQNGHETYIDLPLASKDFLSEDTGPLAINFNLTLDVVSERFHKILNKPAPIGGLILTDGAIYDISNIILQNILTEIKDRGLLIIDAVSEDGINKLKIDGLARRKADIVINDTMSKSEIKSLLEKAETIAFDKGQVLVIADSKPYIIIALYNWIQTFSPQISYEEAKAVDITKPFALVPVSNLVVE